MIEKEPFRKYRLNDNPQDITFTVRITPKDWVWFTEAKKTIKQAKPSTALKQLAEIGWIVLQDPKMMKIYDVLMGNSRRNERIGVSEGELEKV